MVWLYAAMLLPYLPYLRAYLALRQVKRRLGGPVCPTRVTDTAASETALPKPIGLWSLVLPLAVEPGAGILARAAHRPAAGLPAGCRHGGAAVGLRAVDVPPPGRHGDQRQRPEPDPGTGARLYWDRSAAEPLGPGRG